MASLTLEVQRGARPGEPKASPCCSSHRYMGWSVMNARRHADSPGEFARALIVNFYRGEAAFSLFLSITMFAGGGKFRRRERKRMDNVESAHPSVRLTHPSNRSIPRFHPSTKPLRAM